MADHEERPAPVGDMAEAIRLALAQTPRAMPDHSPEELLLRHAQEAQEPKKGGYKPKRKRGKGSQRGSRRKGRGRGER